MSRRQRRQRSELPQEVQPAAVHADGGLFVAANARTHTTDATSGFITFDSVSVADPARERRVKALACTGPVHEIQVNRGLRGWERYDCYEVALAAIDAVVDRMGFDSGIRRPELEERVTAEAARFWPDGPAREHRSFAAHVVETLIRPRQAGYQDAGDGRRRRFDFRLLDEIDAGDGIYLRATNEAINVLVGALDVDLESTHAAAEARLENLIRRRRLPEAAIAAKEARYRSVQYMLEVARYIAETKRDIRRAGWHEGIPARLKDMLDHLSERLEVERRMLAAMRDARDEADRENLRRSAAELVVIVEDCVHRHTELHVKVMEAEAIFFAEQDRQIFAWTGSLRTTDPTEEVLLPILNASIEEASPLLAAFAARTWGAQAPVAPRLGRLIELLLQPPPQREVLADPVEEPEWELPADEPRVFDDRAWAKSDAVLEALDPDQPVRLGILVEQARSSGGHLAAELVRLRGMTAVAPAFDQLQPGGRSILAAVADGTRFPAGAPLWGDDLLLGRLAPSDKAADDGTGDSGAPAPPEQVLASNSGVQRPGEV